MLWISGKLSRGDIDQFCFDPSHNCGGFVTTGTKRQHSAKQNYGKLWHHNFHQKAAPMTKSRAEQMVERLRTMQASAPDIEASAIVSVDGLIMASALPQEVEEDRVSAMSAAMLSLGERISGELGRGMLDQVYIKGNAGAIVLTSVGEEAVLTALARQEAKLGLIFLEMRRAAEDLAKLVG
jgi:predicted regulator of Ras-like GTPase activity (Roadblock/LC7/MglB family)